MTEHDELLGRALRDLDVPAHRPGWHADLRSELNRAAAEQRSARRRWPRRLSLAAAAVAAAVAIVVAGLPGERPRPVSAAEVRRTVAQAWARASSVAGELVVRDTVQSQQRRWRFLVTDDGSFRLEDLNLGGVVAYDASERVERALRASESVGEAGTRFATERGGLALGPPDPHGMADVLDRNLGSVVRALATESGGRVRTAKIDGRDAWVLDTPVRQNLIVPEHSPNHLEVWVDRRTGFPVRSIATRGDEFVWETRIDRLTVDADVPADAFDVSYGTTEVSRSDEGFRPTTLDDVAVLSGYAPVVPRRTPDGYEPAGVVYSPGGTITGTEGGNPRGPDVISTIYRRGLDRFIVTTRRHGGDPVAWSDPLATGEGFVDRSDRIEIDEGVLSGRTVALLIDPLAVPHVWGFAGDLIVTVAGDLTRDELIDVTRSLEEQR